MMKLLIFLLLFFPSILFSQDTGHSKFMGVGSCSSSNCHGSTAPRNSTNVLQNEFVTFYKNDKHSKAWLVLTNSDSKKIATNLGLASPEKEPLCLECHSTFVPEGQKTGERFKLEDGVGCEGCHGAAGAWLQSHTSNHGDHKKNIEMGMSNIVDPEDRSKLCMSCHFGNEDKFVDHKLYGAGHPRLSFELDTFSMIQPRHWEVDEDYTKRKGGYNSTQSWLLGQKAQAVAIIDRLLSTKRAMAGSMPELSTFYCYSCHHNLSDKQFREREYSGLPGTLKPNLASLLIFAEVLKASNNKDAVELQKLITELHSKFQTGNPEQLLTKIKVLIDSVELKVSDPRAVLQQLSDFGGSHSSLQYEVAEQISMGIASILASAPDLADTYKSKLAPLFNTLQDPEKYQPHKFSLACKAFN